MENYLEFLSPNLNHALAWMVIHSLWQATLIALIVGIFMIINNKKSPQFRYALGNVGLLLIIISSIATFLYYYYQSDGNPNVSYISNTFDIQTKAQLTITPEQASLSISNVDESNLFNKTALINYFNQNIYTIVLIWLFGMVLFLMRLLGGISYVYYLKHRMNFPVDEYWSELLKTVKTKLKFSKTIEFVESALVRSPMVIGHLKPIILFPIGSINKLEVNEVEAILAHEIAHILRNDYLINILQTILEAIFYFHPAVWWLSSQVRIERENCCDDVAVKICGNSLTYAKSLVRVQEMTYIQNPQIAMSAGGQKRSLLFHRVQRILNHKQHKTTISDKLISFGVILSIILCVSFVDSKLNINKSYGAIKKLESTIALDSNSTYIKYYNNAGELDSFIITGKIKDGIYDFTDRLYTAILEVKNNFVISFNINGLQVDKKDFQKFSGIINQIILTNNEQDNSEVNVTSSKPSNTLSYSYDPFTNEIQSSTEHNNRKHSEKNASWFLEHAREYPGNYIKRNNGTLFQLLTNDGQFYEFDEQGTIVHEIHPNKKIYTPQIADVYIPNINSIQLTSNQITEMIDEQKSTIEDLSDLAAELSRTRNNNHDIKRTENELNSLENELEGIENELNHNINQFSNLKDLEQSKKLNIELKKLEKELDKSKSKIKHNQNKLLQLNADTERGTVCGQTNSYISPEWVASIGKELKKDKLLHSEYNSISIQHNYMLVNNQRLKDKEFKKYKKLYEDITGNQITPGTNITMCFNGPQLLTENIYQNTNDETYSNNDTEYNYPSFMNALIIGLNKGGYIDFGKPIQFELSNKIFKINGNKLNTSELNGYLKQATEDSNNDIAPNFKYTFNGIINGIDGFNVRLSGKLNTDTSK